MRVNGRPASTGPWRRGRTPARRRLPPAGARRSLGSADRSQPTQATRGGAVDTPASTPALRTKTGTGPRLQRVERYPATPSTGNAATTRTAAAASRDLREPDRQVVGEDAVADRGRDPVPAEEAEPGGGDDRHDLGRSRDREEGFERDDECDPPDRQSERVGAPPCVVQPVVEREEGEREGDAPEPCHRVERRDEPRGDPASRTNAPRWAAGTGAWSRLYPRGARPRRCRAGWRQPPRSPSIRRPSGFTLIVPEGSRATITGRSLTVVPHPPPWPRSGIDVPSLNFRNPSG